MFVPILKASNSLSRGIRSQEQIHPEKRPAGEAALQYKGLPSPSGPELLLEVRQRLVPLGNTEKQLTQVSSQPISIGKKHRAALTSMECFTKDLV